jgi:hypothetical protein
LLRYNSISITIAKNPYYISKDSSDMLNSYKSINIILKVINNLNIIKRKAGAKELYITSSQRQALKMYSLVKG